MRVDPSNAAAVQPLSLKKTHHFRVFSDDGLRKGPEQRKDFVAIAQRAACEFARHEGVDQHFRVTQKRLQAPVPCAKVVDPDGGIDENHATRPGLRRLMGLRPGSDPPSFASRRALSRAINASNPRRTRAVFLGIPVNRAARRIRDVSIFNVVLMYAL